MKCESGRNSPGTHLIRTASVFIFFLIATSAFAQQITPDLLQAMHWRLIGPFRGGRVTSVCGVPHQPAIYYMGTPGGGVWKTEDAGRVWKPIFDQEHVASIGAVAVSPSNPRVVYVGTGEQTQGNGVYKSTDAGATWVNIGLNGTHIITGILVDPRDPSVVLVAAAGDYASGDQRGVFKTTDGGKQWERVLFKNNQSGIADLESAPDNARIIYATLWTRPADPFNPPEERTKEQDAAIYKSTDEGSTWSPVEGKGLPNEPLGRVGVAVAPATNGMRVFAISRQGLFLSNDGGATWQRSTTDPRILGNGYFSRVFVDPGNPDILYVAQTSLYRSTDGGRTFDAFVGAPSGDDFHVLWINPVDTRNMILGVDQGAIVSLDGGQTWSSWYNQPTGQFYHVSTDEQYPYHVYAAQQDSGTAALPSRSDYGEITYRDWAPIGGFEASYIVQDPVNLNYVYANGWYGSVLRYDRGTGQITHLLVRNARYRTSVMPPIAFSPHDPYTLYAAAQYVLKTSDGGHSWQEVSPDLTRKRGTSEEKPDRRAVITTMSLSRVKAGEIWVGTGNGVIQVTTGGNSWQNVTIANLPPRSTVAVIEASRHNAATAYAVINAFRDLRPLIYRTYDYGRSWQLITAGLPTSGSARVVREDPVRRGLLYAGTTNGVYVSLDDGDHWQSLQLDLPTTPVTDLDVHGDDLVASTFGRSLWILDDITPLRNLSAAVLQSEAALLLPPNAARTRWDMYQDTPLPPETPAGKNPPDGAIIDYFLKSVPNREIKLSIYDSKNNLVREFSSVPPPVDNTPANVPSYWFAPPAVLTKRAGLNRFAWDLRYPPPKTLAYSYYGQRLDYIEYTLADHAIPGETPREQPQGPLVVPGDYSLVLEVNGRTYLQSLTVTIDSRVPASQADLVRQLDVEKSISAQMAATYEGCNQVTSLRAAIDALQKSAEGKPEMKEAHAALKALDEQVAKLEDGTPQELGFGGLNRELARLAILIESGDARPAALLEAGVSQSCQVLIKRAAEWRDVNGEKVPPVNALLQTHGLPQLPVLSNISAPPECGR